MDIPVFRPSLGPEEIDNVVEAVSTGAISGTFGRFITEFEVGFADYCGASHGVATTSGTTALQLALRALGVGPGDEVILPTFTNIASCLAVVYNGATPVLVDSEPRTWNMDVTLIERLITTRTKAIMPVHIYGHPVDMDPVLELCRSNELLLVEDAAEAHGAEYRGRKVGALGNAGCFSFYANKVLTTGEGGMIVTNDADVAEHARTLRDLSFIKEKRFLHKELGFNFRMTNLQAGLGVAQLGRITPIIERKRAIARLYTEALSGLVGITLPVEEPWAKNVYWMYAIVIEDEFGTERDRVMEMLAARGIETRTFFLGMHRQPAFHNMGLFVEVECPVADSIGARGLYLPSALDITDDEINYVADSLRAIQRGVRTTE